MTFNYNLTASTSWFHILPWGQWSFLRMHRRNFFMDRLHLEDTFDIYIIPVPFTNEKINKWKKSKTLMSPTRNASEFKILLTFTWATFPKVPLHANIKSINWLDPLTSLWQNKPKANWYPIKMVFRIFVDEKEKSKYVLTFLHYITKSWLKGKVVEVDLVSLWKVFEKSAYFIIFHWATRI